MIQRSSLGKLLGREGMHFMLEVAVTEVPVPPGAAPETPHAAPGGPSKSIDRDARQARDRGAGFRRARFSLEAQGLEYLGGLLHGHGLVASAAVLRDGLSIGRLVFFVVVAAEAARGSRRGRGCSDNCPNRPQVPKRHSCRRCSPAFSRPRRHPPLVWRPTSGWVSRNRSRARRGCGGRPRRSDVVGLQKLPRPLLEVGERGGQLAERHRPVDGAVRQIERVRGAIVATALHRVNRESLLPAAASSARSSRSRLSGCRGSRPTGIFCRFLSEATKRPAISGPMRAWIPDDMLPPTIIMRTVWVAVLASSSANLGITGGGPRRTSPASGTFRGSPVRGPAPAGLERRGDRPRVGVGDHLDELPGAAILLSTGRAPLPRRGSRRTPRVRAAKPA